MRKDKSGGDHYLIDGIVVMPDIALKFPDNKNPEHIRAYKENIAGIETEVTKVVWNISKWGKLIPVVHFKPVKISGAVIQKATGFHARYIVDNKVNTGSVVEIIRSGEVIPYINRVIKSSDTPAWPEQKVIWNGYDLQLENILEASTARFIGSIKIIEIRDLGEKRVEELIKHGIDDFRKLFMTPVEKFQEIFKTNMGLKIYQHVRNAFDTTTLDKWMVASGIFGYGFGKTKSLSVVTAIDDFRNPPKYMKFKDLSEEQSRLTLEKIPYFA